MAAWPGLVNAFCLPLGKKYVKKYRINVQFYSVRNKQILNTHKIKLIISKDIKKIKRNKKGQKFAGLAIAASWPMIVNVFAEILHQLGTSCSHLTKAFVKLPELSFQVSPHCKLVKALG